LLQSLTRKKEAPNKSLELSPWVVFWFEAFVVAVVRFALVIRRRNSTLCSTRGTAEES
jgi:hypothetical protein